MEDLLISLAILTVFAVPVMLIVLVISHVRLRRRVADLERRADARGEMPLPSRAGITTPSDPAAMAPRDARSSAGDATAPGPWQPPAGDAADNPGDGIPAPAPAPASAPAHVAARGPSLAVRLAGWVRDNWVYAVSAVSLVLAAVFLVQYGVEKGLLPPSVRVALTLLFGAALIAGGEWMRRRFGDGEEVATAYLPSVFAGAGVVALFVGVLSARRLYDLIGVAPAFAGLMAVAVVAVLLGWFYGPLLAAVGFTGAMAAPFVVGGNSGPVPWLWAYLGVVALAGLVVDAMRRWRWVSVLVVSLAAVGGLLFYGAADYASGRGVWTGLLLVALVLASIAAPILSLWPWHDGPGIGALRRGQRPDFTVLLAAGTTLAASLFLALVPAESQAEAVVLFLLPAGLAAGLTVWTVRAPALTLLPALPGLAFIARLFTEAASYGPLYRHFREAAQRGPEVPAPLTISLLLVLATGVALATFWRSQAARGAYRPWFAAAGAIFAPAAAIQMEFFWAPAAVIGRYAWALQIIAIAGLMVAAAAVFARADGAERRRAAYAALSALTMIAFAVFVLLAQGALTMALAVLLVAAVALDRNFRLPEMGWFIQCGVIVLGYRLVVDPGVDWARYAPFAEVAAAYVTAAGGAAVALWLLRPLDRPRAKVFLESAVAGFAGLTLNVFLYRWIRAYSDPWEMWSHWSLSLGAMTWAVVALVQLYRMRAGGPLNRLRMVLASIAGLLAAAGLVGAVFPANPVLTGDRVHGPLLADTMLVAYGLPGLALLAAALRGLVPARLALPLKSVGAGLVLLYLALEIRRFWQGEAMAANAMSEGELYSYTVALLILGAGLLWQAIARRSAGLRRLAMAVIGLTVAKVFLVDASGLAGLVRVFSFLALGLSLAGLAWLNRWAAGRANDAETR